MTEQTRRQVRTLSSGLIVYGVIGIVMAMVMLGAVVAIGNRLDSLAERTSGRLATISATLDRTATALERAGATSQSFAGTLDQAAPTLAQVDTALTDVVATLKDLETTTGNLTFLGQQPLASLSGRFDRIATQLSTLQTQIGTLGTNLTDNQTNLVSLGTSLTDLAAQIRDVNTVVGSGEIESSLAEILSVVRLALGLLAVWFAVPAIAALGFGIWVRRQVRATATQGPAAA
jgi:septal ring factor EnvC (AmiA/AmiB activator)